MSMISKKKYGFYVSGKATRLTEIIKSFPIIFDNTVVVINDGESNPYLLEYFNNNNITYEEVDYSGIHKKDRNKFISSYLLEGLRLHKVDYTFCFGARLLKGEILNEFKNRIINFHPSILPMYPGEKSIDKAIKGSSFLVGNTAHFIDEGIDTGPIIIQNVMSLDSSLSYDDILNQQIPMIRQIYHWLNEERIKVINNKTEVIAGKASIAFYPALEF